MNNRWDAPLARPSLPKINWNWLGVMPFFLFALLFLILPASSLFVGSFQDNQGQFTFNNLKNLFTPYILNSYKLTIQVSLVTAVGGALFGFLMAYAVTLGGLPRWLRTALTTFRGSPATSRACPWPLRSSLPWGAWAW